MKISTTKQATIFPGTPKNLAKKRIYKISVMVPSAWLETVKEAMFAAGAGHYGTYDCCCWQAQGTGQFRPLQGSRPFSGQPGETHAEETWKVEMICEQPSLKPAIEALHRAHPYEMPAFYYHLVSLAAPED